MASLRTLAAELTAEITLLQPPSPTCWNTTTATAPSRPLPGIGAVLAAVLVAEIGDITRFASPARLCSRAGPTPRHRKSDVNVSRGYIR